MSLTVDMESDSVYHQTHTIHTDQEEEERKSEWWKALEASDDSFFWFKSIVSFHRNQQEQFVFYDDSPSTHLIV